MREKWSQMMSKLPHLALHERLLHKEVDHIVDRFEDPEDPATEAPDPIQEHVEDLTPANPNGHRSDRKVAMVSTATITLPRQQATSSEQRWPGRDARCGGERGGR